MVLIPLYVSLCVSTWSPISCYKLLFKYHESYRVIFVFVTGSVTFHLGPCGFMVPSYSRMFQDIQDIPQYSMMFYEVPLVSMKFHYFSRSFHDVPRSSGVFYDVLSGSIRFYHLFPECSKTFHVVLYCSIGFHHVPQGFVSFARVCRCLLGSVGVY